MNPNSSPLDEARAVLLQHFGYDRFKPAQEQVILAALGGEDVLAVLQTGYGKCQKRGSLALMHDGTTRKVEDVCVGDLLMGPDSRPRRVLRTDSGRDRMVKVTPTKGDPFFVTTDHILTLVHTVTGEIVDVRVDVWQTWNEHRKHHYKLFRVPVEFPRRVLPLDPYMLGVILGDGSLTEPYRVAVTKPDAEIARACGALAVAYGLRVRTSYRNGCPTHHFSKLANNPTKPNGLLCALRELRLLPIASQDRFIPRIYLTAHRDDRLDLLAGLLDTDGSLMPPGGGYEFKSKSKQLADGVTFLARSLGFLATLGRCGPGHEFYRVTISGDCSVIPCRITRKKARPRQQKKDVLRTGFSVEPAGQDDYFGFLLDGDHRYLMGDFTVTHNSVCFQIPAAMRDGCALVISPLIALMKDQVDGANAKGIKSSFVNSSLDADEVAKRLSEFAAGEFKLLYVAPERITTNLFRAALAKATVSFIVVDEAHCASMWGHDFRPAFARIHEISSMLWQAHNTRPPIIAVTATATPDIETDIAAAVGMSDGYVRIVGDPVRPNLAYDTMNAQYSEWSSVMRLARQRFSLPGRHLVYASTRKGAEKVVEMLTQDFGKGFALAYHGGMDKDDRTTVQDAFVRGKVSVVVATNAFGMGIDVPDIRTVAHLGVPGSIESYVQETGRAGRDGQPSAVVLIPSEFAESLQYRFIDGNNPPLPVYVRLWDWLCEKAAGTVLKMSAASIAETLKRVAPELGDLSESAVSTALNVLEGHKLIARAYYEGGAPVKVRLDEGSQATLRGSTVGKWLLARAREVAGHTSVDEVEIGVDKTDAPFEIGVSARAFATKLTELELADVIDVGRVFTGKTTTVLNAEVDLMEVLPVDRLKAKRDRDLSRFRAMLDYSRLGSNEARRKFIRDYFLGEQVGQARPQGL